MFLSRLFIDFLFFCFLFLLSLSLCFCFFHLSSSSPACWWTTSSRWGSSWRRCSSRWERNRWVKQMYTNTCQWVLINCHRGLRVWWSHWCRWSDLPLWLKVKMFARNWQRSPQPSSRTRCFNTLAFPSKCVEKWSFWEFDYNWKHFWNKLFKNVNFEFKHPLKHTIMRTPSFINLSNGATCTVDVQHPPNKTGRRGCLKKYVRL